MDSKCNRNENNQQKYKKVEKCKEEIMRKKWDRIACKFTHTFLGLECKFRDREETMKISIDFYIYTITIPFNISIHCKSIFN